MSTFIEDITAWRIMNLATRFCEWVDGLTDDEPIPQLKELGDRFGYADVADPFTCSAHLRAYLPGLHAIYKQRVYDAQQVCRRKVHALADAQERGSLKAAYAVGREYGLGRDRILAWYREIGMPRAPRYDWEDITTQLKVLLKTTPPLEGATSVRMLCTLLRSAEPVSMHSFYSWLRRTETPLADKLFAAFKKNRGTHDRLIARTCHRDA